MKAAYAPNRLLKPLIRTGSRGSGEYKEVSWDDALDYVAAGLSKIKGTFGCESILFLGGSGSCRGALHNTSSLTRRFLNISGNIAKMGDASGGCIWNGLPVPQCGGMDTAARSENPIIPEYCWPDAILEGKSGRYPADIKAMEPPGNVKNDYDIFCELSNRLGFLDIYSEGKTAAQWIKQFVAESVIPDCEHFRQTGICRESGRVSMGKEWTKPVQQTFLRRQNQPNHVWDLGHTRYWWRLNHQ